MRRVSITVFMMLDFPWLIVALVNFGHWSGGEPKGHFVNLLRRAENQQLVAGVQSLRATGTEHWTMVALDTNDLDAEQRVQRKIAQRFADVTRAGRHS